MTIVGATPTASSTTTYPGEGDMSFGSMKANVCAYYGMDDDPRKLDLAGTMIKSVIDELNLAQVWIFNLTTSPDITTASGTSTYSIPSDFWKTYNVRKTDDIDYQLTVLRQKHQDSYFQSQTNISGYPFVAVIKNTFRDGTIQLFPTPDGVYTISLRYFKLIARPTSDADFLDLPTPYQVVPFYGALSRFAALNENPSGMRYWDMQYQRVYQMMKMNDEDIGDDDSLRFINIEELEGRAFNYVNPAARPRAYDLF